MKLFSLKSIQFDQIMSEIQNYLAKVNGSAKSINKSTVFGQFLTVVAGIAHNLMLYIEDSLVEQNKYTAQRKKSVYGLAAQSGYQPSYGKAAGVWVKIAHKPNNRTALDTIIPEHQKIVCSANGLYYNLILNQSAITLKSNDVQRANEYFYAVQGQFESQRFVATGGNLYVQNIKYIGYLDADYVRVKINGTEWTKRDSLYDMRANEEAFAIRYNPVGGVDIVFGTGIYGKQLAEGDVIEVSYLIHDGESGNTDVKENTYFLFATMLHDVAGDEFDGNKTFDIRFATADAVASGADPESIGQVRNMIGFNSRALVLSDPKAYQAFLNRFSFVGYNRTWSEPGSLIVNSLVMRNYKLDMKDGLDYFALSSGESDDIIRAKFNLSDLQKQSIKNAIINSGMQLAGATYNILDIELVYYSLYVYIRLKDSQADHTIISTKIRKLVGEFFGNIQSDSYVPKSDIINLIKQNIPEVDGVTCYFLSERNERALKMGEYDDTQYLYDPSTGTYRWKTVHVKLTVGQDGQYENPMIGLDAHGNISIDADNQFPVLGGNWDWMNKEGQEVQVVDPLTIIFE